MSWIAAAIIGGAVIGGAASGHAANQQAGAANRATDTQLQMFNQTRADLQPYREAGYTALGTIGANSDYFGHQFDAKDLTDNLAPNYAFMRDQGLGAVTSQANAMGGLGGNSLTSAARWATDYAQNAYQQAFQNYQDQRTGIFNRLASIAGLGQTSASNSATGGSSYGSGIAGSMMGAGNAMAAGTMGVSGAINNGINSYIGYTTLNNIMRGGGLTG